MNQESRVGRGIFGKRSVSFRDSFRRGFSLVEMLLVLAIFAIITLFAVSAFSKATGREALDKKTGVVLSLLEQARNLTLSAKGASVYGVHFETAKAVLFTGPTYSASATSNVIESVNSPVQISSISLSGGVSDVVFSRLIGDTGQSGTITLSLIASSTQAKTITIFATGIASSN